MDKNDKSILVNEKELFCSSTLGELFNEVAEHYSEKSAIRYYDNEVTYHDLCKIKAKISKEMCDLGIEKGDRVCVNMVNGVSLIAVILAIYDIGAIYIPIDINCPKERTEDIINISKAKLFVQSAEKMDSLKIDINNFTSIDEENNICFRKNSLSIDNGCFENISENRLASENIAYIMFTSGTTGKPKGVMINHNSVVNLLRSMTELLDLNDKDSTMLLTNICFDISVLEIFLPLINGMTLCLLRKRDIENPTELRKYIDLYGVSFLQFTPSRFKQTFYLDQSYLQTKPQTVKKYLLGGEKLDGICKEIIRCCWKEELYNMYGPTETTIWSTIKRVGKDISIGLPIHNTYIYILDKNGQLVNRGERGEICIGGIGVARGYCNDERNKKNFIKDPLNKKRTIYKTGDIGAIGIDGDLHCYGRMDNQIKLHGYRIELDEIEKVAMNSNMVDFVYVMAEGDNEEDKKLIMYLIQNSKFKFNEYVSNLRSFLPAYMLPAKYIEIYDIPVNNNGKVSVKNISADRYKVLGLLGVKPRNDVEKSIYSIWENLINEKKFGIHDNFYDIGGSSFYYYFMLAQVSKQYNLDLSKLKYNEFSTIETLAEYIIAKLNTVK